MFKILTILSIFMSSLLCFTVSHAQTLDLDDSTKESATKEKDKRKVKKKPQVNEQVNDLSSDAIYQRQISQIEAQINELKGEIISSRARLNILKESILASGLQGTELHLIHRNELGSRFKLIKLMYMLDGQTIREADNQDGKLAQQEEIEIINGQIVPGNHQLQVELIYQGNGYGVFSYLQSYRFTLDKIHGFIAEEGKRLTLEVIAYEQEGLVDINQVPKLRVKSSSKSLDEDKSSKN